jgi:hypothetical protein
VGGSVADGRCGDAAPEGSPVAVLAWDELAESKLTHYRFLGWVDLNMIACLQRSILRPLVRAPLDWVLVRDMPQVTHRLRADPV